MSELTPPKMIPLDLTVSVEATYQGIEMGVLQNGMPYLTQTGLAELCGLKSRTSISDIATEWAECQSHGVFTKGRMEFISSYLSQEGYNEPDLYISFIKNGSPTYAFPDVVCMAILEYYAFVSEQTASKTTAQQNYRTLARLGLRGYIYSALRYQPEDPWKPYHDRVSIMKSQGSVPDGYFIVFNEIAGLMVDLIHAGLAVNMYTVPDISVGLTWARFWKDENYSADFGGIVKCSHYYPDEFNQSGSNPQSINAYPNTALAAFRSWFKHVYLPTKFPKYILTKANLLSGGQDEALRIADNFKNKLLN